MSVVALSVSLISERLILTLKSTQNTLALIINLARGLFLKNPSREEYDKRNALILKI